MDTTIPAPTHLLERAYQLINANQLENAELVLDAVVRVEPQNVEAWKTYLQILENQNGLDWLKERALKTKELSEANKNEIINYHQYLTEQMNAEKESFLYTGIFALPQAEKEIFAMEETAIRFELIDVFDYPQKAVKIETRARPRRRAIYNTFIFDIGKGVLEKAAKYPAGKQLAAYIQKAVTLANDLAKNPVDSYIKFLESPHFEKSVGISLLTLFVLGIRLVAGGYLLGYLFLGMFIIGGGWWLVNFGSNSVNTLSSQVRVYLHENENNLPVIKAVEIDQEQKAGKEPLEKVIK